ncbi:steroid 3-ketoacyl-CoA thiolase [Saccharomonospora cyanea]|uniref:Acetyl-CoA acetyltransferase n=1 Tax=Saccharomonospora cyanea NA-134 TaxID=882082 RepID=H5XHM3_9PSEU|nr:steroid 3-ketoacyl-CoA thiolase [Saccharomonospora cyanea]EHR61703.1 acetyl-CoA acetyltransferase [Saccharomonospora cyanea NA-134]
MTSRAVVVDAVRTPISKRGGVLSGMRPAELLRTVLLELLRRNRLEPSAVQQIVGGCVTQVGEQGFNVTRCAWLSTGLDHTVPCLTIDASCGSAQQANELIRAQIDAGVLDLGIACGVESMSRVPAGANIPGGKRDYQTDDYPWDDPPGLQFGGAERIARRQGHTREQLDAFGVRSQRLAAAARDRGVFAEEIVPVETPNGVVTEDEGIRDSTPETLATLRTTLREGLHTAATTSQVSDGAAAVLWMSAERAQALGLRPIGRVVGHTFVGADPYYLLDGPVDATRAVLDRTGMALADLDLAEVNEAFASVVLSWVERTGADLDRVNVNGGAIALGHPMGATGARLVATALGELRRRDREHALVTMCCGGSLGTATVLQRL